MPHHETLHQKVQEMADCYKGTDYLKEMCLVPGEPDTEQAAQKWVALAVLHGIDAQADEISIRRTADGTVTVQAEYRPKRLPSPEDQAGRRAMGLLRDLVHVEEDQGKARLVFGWGNESLDLKVKVKRKDDMETITLKFP